MSSMNTFVRNELPGEPNAAVPDVLLDIHEISLLLIAVELVLNRYEMHLNLIIVGF